MFCDLKGDGKMKMSASSLDLLKKKKTTSLLVLSPKYARNSRGRSCVNLLSPDSKANP